MTIGNVFGWRPQRNPTSIPPDAHLAEMEAEIARITNEDERTRLENLRKNALEMDEDESRNHVANYIRREVSGIAGPRQIWLPFAGTIVLATLIVVLLFMETVNIFVPFGLNDEVFKWVVIAGAAGGVVKVLRTSLQTAHRARTNSGLFVTGVIHPMIGVMFAFVVVAAFQSGFIGMPSAQVATSTPTDLSDFWTPDDSFLILAAFVAGFTEDFVTGIINRVANK
ncbi:MAG: hypothetical protein QF898_00840 [SAR202 cluster bacterium]|jgi:hypothetical protein|nr:hypothetical protein [SAR202 cluster bacterium]